MAWDCIVEGGAVLTQDFGPTSYAPEPICGGRHFHSGLDLASHCGAPIHSVCDGVVVAIGDDPGYGPFAVFVQAGQVVLLYGHLRGAAVSVGQQVTAGQVIGYEGTLGNSTGCHVHFSVRPASNRLTECGALDPYPFVCACPSNPPAPPPPPPPPPPPLPAPLPVAMLGGAGPEIAGLLLVALSAAGALYWTQRRPGEPVTLRNVERDLADALRSGLHAGGSAAGRGLAALERLV